MAASNLNLGKASGGVLNIQPADGTTTTSIVLPASGTVATTIDVNAVGTIVSNHVALSGVAAYHLLQGNLSIDSSVITQGFNTTLYTGNGGTQSITTGIDMSTQWGNDASEKFGGLVWIKSRSLGYSNYLVDTIRGINKDIYTNTTGAEDTTTGRVLSFDNNGITLGSDIGRNQNTATYTSWNFQTTHRISGVTNHGKPYTCHYNPFTGFTMVKYEGSGIAGHEIPHHLGRKLGFVFLKDLVRADGWIATNTENKILKLNENVAQTADNTNVIELNDGFTTVGTNTNVNASAESYIMYGWANSYFDSANKLIGNYEIGVYQGTGASGNKVTTRGKPAWVMIKRLDASSNWTIADNKRLSPAGQIFANSSSAEVGDISNFVYLEADGLNIRQGNSNTNTSGGQYLYIVAYDTNSNGGGSYYPLASDTANLQVNNALIPIAQGIDSNGVKNTILSKNETFSGVTYTQGKNYPYYDALGNVGVSNKAPNYGTINPANGGDFYNVLSNKWYTSDGVEIPEGRNYLNHIVYADNDGGVLYVEELPKIEYKDMVQVDKLKINNGFDLGQTWKNVTTSRAAGITYTNSTGKPIMVSVAIADYRGYSYASGINAYVDNNVTSRVF